MHTSNSSLHRHVTRSAPVALIATIVTGMAVSLGLAAAPNEAIAKATLGGALSGSTSQGNPGRVRVSGNGRTIADASITIDVRCPFGSFLLPQKVRSLPIRPNGRFRGTWEDTSEEEGMVLHIFESLSGKFSADRTSVAVRSRLRLNFQAPDGTVEACDSGPVTMHATR